jgi:SAM-dependent methyltransferase
MRAAWENDPDVARRYAIAERATRPFARMMVEMSRELSSSSSPAAKEGGKEEVEVDVFDLGCGTGAVEAEMYAALGEGEKERMRILAGDVSPPMLAYLASRAEQEGWGGVSTHTVDGTRLTEVAVLEGKTFDHVYVGFAVFMLPPSVPSQLAALVKPGGTLALTSWADLPWFPVLAEAYKRMADGPDQPVQADVWSAVTNGLAWQDTAFVQQTLEEAGLGKVEVKKEKVAVDVGDADTVMGSMGFVLGILSQQWPEGKREGWLADAKRAFREVLVERRGEGEGMEWVFEGIVGVGVKPL